MDLELRDIKGNAVMISEEEFNKIVKFGKEYFDMVVEEEKNEKLTKNLIPVVKELFDGLNDLNYECFKVFSSPAPSRATFERTTSILNKYREVLQFPNFIGDDSMLENEKGDEMSNLNFLQQKTIDYDEQVIGKPDWLSAPSWANWLGRDNNGVWHWFEKMPELKGTNWVFSGGYEQIKNNNQQISTMKKNNTVIEKVVGLTEYQIDDLINYLKNEGILSRNTIAKASIVEWLENQTFTEKNKEVIEVSKPSWNDAPKDANWLACDRYGGWNWHQERPFVDFGVWSSKGLQAKCQMFNWGDTLEARPTNKKFIEIGSVWKYNDLIWTVSDTTRYHVWCYCLINGEESKIKWHSTKEEFLNLFSES